MRIITLNTWQGRELEPLLEFFRKYAVSTDVFCLQEVFNTEREHIEHHIVDHQSRWDLFSQITRVLSGFEGTFATHDDDPHRMSLAMFFRGDLPVKTISDFVVYAPPAPKEQGRAIFSTRKLQTLTLERGGQEFLIANFHGLWNGGPKTDAPERLEQSRKVKAAIDAHGGPKILCGDFNLLPDTESLAIMATGMKDLLRESGAVSTRTPLYREHADPTVPKYADYILASPEIAVRKFEVLPEVVSDHAALSVEIA